MIDNEPVDPLALIAVLKEQIGELSVKVAVLEVQLKNERARAHGADSES